MSWLDNIALDRTKLMPATTPEIVRLIEHRLSCSFPSDYREFLYSADGGIIGNFMLYSAGKGFHPQETLLAANEGREAVFPIIAIGADATDDFGFRKVDLPAESCSVYFIGHETYDLYKVANSFKDFLMQIASLKPGEPLVVRSNGKGLLP
jgi:cell wall assembly regulator SMI1